MGEESGRDVLRLETSSGSGDRRDGGQRRENARITQPGQAPPAGFRHIQLVTHLQKWQYPRRFVGHACYLLGGVAPSDYPRRAPGRSKQSCENTTRVHEIRLGPSWMDPIVAFLKDDILPETKSEAQKIQRNATRFWLSKDHKLYRRFYSGPYLLCVHPEASELLLEELHEGICDNHTGGRSLSHRALT